MALSDADVQKQVRVLGLSLTKPRRLSGGDGLAPGSRRARALGSLDAGGGSLAPNLRVLLVCLREGVSLTRN